jgi:hypothetical protein
MNFQFVINLETTRAVGHEVPAALVLRADKESTHWEFFAQTVRTA